MDINEKRTVEITTRTETTRKKGKIGGNMIFFELPESMKSEPDETSEDS